MVNVFFYPFDLFKIVNKKLQSCFWRKLPIKILPPTKLNMNCQYFIFQQSNFIFYFFLCQIYIFLWFIKLSQCTFICKFYLFIYVQFTFIEFLISICGDAVYFLFYFVNFLYFIYFFNIIYCFREINKNLNIIQNMFLGLFYHYFIFCIPCVWFDNEQFIEISK